MRFKVISDGTDGFQVVWENVDPKGQPVAVVSGFPTADHANAFIQDLLVKVARAFRPTH